MACGLLLTQALRHGRAYADSPGATDTASFESWPATQNEAKKRFSRGLELVKDNDYEGALVEFRSAYGLLPTYQVLYNIGQVSLLLADYAGAIRALQQYLVDGGSEIAPDRRHTVERDLETLRTRVGTLTIRTNLPDATVLVDGVAIGKTPLRDPVLVSIGPRRLSAVVDGRPPAIRDLMVVGAETVTVDLSFSASTTPDAAAPSSSTSTGAGSVMASRSEMKAVPSTSRARVPSWPFWAAAGGLATAASILGVAALRSASDLEHGRNTLGTTRRDLDETRSQAAELALAADIVTAAALVCGGLGLYVSLTNRAGPHWTSPQAKEGRPTLGIEMGAGTLRVQGAF